MVPSHSVVSMLRVSTQRPTTTHSTRAILAFSRASVFMQWQRDHAEQPGPLQQRHHLHQSQPVRLHRQRDLRLRREQLLAVTTTPSRSVPRQQPVRSWPQLRQWSDQFRRRLAIPYFNVVRPESQSAPPYQVGRYQQEHQRMVRRRQLRLQGRQGFASYQALDNNNNVRRYGGIDSSDLWTAWS
jgi:hypothetical protein